MSVRAPLVITTAGCALERWTAVRVNKEWRVAARYAVATAHWRELQGAGAVNPAALHAWLVREHGYGGVSPE